MSGKLSSYIETKLKLLTSFQDAACKQAGLEICFVLLGNASTFWSGLRIQTTLDFSCFILSKTTCRYLVHNSTTDDTKHREIHGLLRWHFPWYNVVPITPVKTGTVGFFRVSWNIQICMHCNFTLGGYKTFLELCSFPPTLSKKKCHDIQYGSSRINGQFYISLSLTE